MTPIAPHITAFLRERLPVEKRASEHTCDSYSYTFQLLFEFASRRLRTKPSALSIEQIDATFVLKFLSYLENERGNSPSTRNARLSAIRAFNRFLEYRVPSALDQIARILAIPFQRIDRFGPKHLTDAEAQAILDAPDPKSRLGVRDRAMIYVALTGGLRVSELVGLRVDEVSFDGSYIDLYVRGKGRRHRQMKLWKSVATAVRAWIAVRRQTSAPELFLNAAGKSMTRSGFERVLSRHVAAAAERCPALHGKDVSPHWLRHTCAFTLLRATGDIRKVALWLGHASTMTTEVYLQTDPASKLEALHSLTPPSLRPGKFRPADRLIASLRSP
jgi:integrase/recombinase XerD